LPRGEPRGRGDAGPNPQVAGRGLYRLQQEGVDVSHGLMMNEAEALNKGFLKRMRTGFPGSS
jgi:diaminohydroxyphosphoribosylaminopyrimidine deaminase/5-amino-6-(5-phosphoribosylamino)uracil reductase